MSRTGSRPAGTPAELGFDPTDPAFIADPYPVHYCLGAPLARLELGIAFGALLRRLPRLEAIESPTWKPTFVLRGLQALRVRI